MKDPLKDIFDAYNPELSPSSAFIEELGRRLDAVKLVKEHNAAYRRRCHRAVALAAVAGMLVGFVLSAFLPEIGGMMHALAPSDFSDNGLMTGLKDAVPWLMLALASTAAAVSTYDILLSLMSRPQKA